MIQYLPILMTAAVSTNGMVGACFSDKERFGMYLETLRFYVSKFILSPNNSIPVKLVFVDNSGWDLSSFVRALKNDFDSKVIYDNVEFISLDVNKFDISKGKGYNELLMINLAIKDSKYVKDSGCFFKVTGRYPIYNLERFLRASVKAFEDGFEFYCDIKDHNLYKRLGLDWNSHTFEARLWGSTVDFYLRNISEEYINCNDYEDKYVECVLFDKFSLLTDAYKKSKKAKMLTRFSREARFGGKEGSSSAAASFSKDQQSLKSRAKIIIGNFFRIFTPWFKF